jgi:glycosyltransferase involved in cell wall biosynthesis
MAWNVMRSDLIPLIGFAAFLLRNEIRIVHLNDSIFSGLPWVVAAKLTGRKVLSHHRGCLPNISPHLRYHHHWLDHILGVSHYIREYLRPFGVDLSKYSTLYNRIDLDRFRGRITQTEQQVRRQFAATPTQPLIGTVGNLQRWKGQRTVIEAIALLREKYSDLKCLLIGDTSNKHRDDILYFEELKEAIRTLGLQSHVLLTGHRQDIPDILQALDVFVHASVDPEAFGRVIVEAMGMGKAVIASNKGGPTEIIENGVSGILIPPGNARLLAEKIDLLLSDPRLRDRLGQEARKRAEEQFTTLDIALVERLYQNLLKT